MYLFQVHFHEIEDSSFFVHKELSSIYSAVPLYMYID